MESLWEGVTFPSAPHPHLNSCSISKSVGPEGPEYGRSPGELSRGGGVPCNLYPAEAEHVAEGAWLSRDGASTGCPHAES